MRCCKTLNNPYDRTVLNSSDIPHEKKGPELLSQNLHCTYLSDPRQVQNCQPVTKGGTLGLKNPRSLTGHFIQL